MKHKIAIPTGLVLAAIIGVCLLRPAQAQKPLSERLQAINEQIRQSADTAPAVVVLTGTQVDGYNSGKPARYVIEIATSSSGAPQFKEGDDLAESLAMLRAQHFVITVHAWGWLTYTAIR